jgi:hypothetical protein
VVFCIVIFCAFSFAVLFIAKIVFLRTRDKKRDKRIKGLSILGKGPDCDHTIDDKDVKWPPTTKNGNGWTI